MMGTIREILARFASFFRKRTMDQELDAELAAHLELAIDENIELGMSPAEARRKALIRLGGLEPAKELHREARSFPILETLMQDLRFSFRTLRRDSGFSTFAILIVGLGIGASSTVFSVVNTLLIRPLPFAEPSSLVWIANTGEGLSDQTVQVNHMLDLRAMNRSFSEIAAYFAFYGTGDVKLISAGRSERLTLLPVSQNFFPILGIQPMLGRLFNDEECKWNGPKAVLLSYGLWERRFGSDPGIVGSALTLSDKLVTVIGVLPASFDFASVFAPGSHFDLYEPFPLSAETNRWGNTIALVGRLKPGITVASADAEVGALSKQISQKHPERNGLNLKLSLLKEQVSGRLRPALILLACAVGVVMLIVCANISNLLLARTASRRKEIAVRMALGAGRLRLIRQMLTESILLSSCGAALGLVLAAAGTQALASMTAMRIPLLGSVHVDWGAIGFTMLAAVATGLLFGLVPALQIPDQTLHDSLKDSSRGTSDGKGPTWVRGMLVVSEIAFACVLLVGAGLLMRSFLEVLNVELGFNPTRTAALRIDPSTKHATQEQQNAYYNEALRLAREIAGVEAVALTDSLPLGRNRSWGAGEKGVAYKRGEYPSAFVRVSSEGYFKAMGIPLRAGRDFTELDLPGSEQVIIVNESMARRLWPGGNALGRVIASGNNGRRVIGVVGNVRHLALEKESGSEMYIPLRQTRDYMSADLVLRTTLPPTELANAVRAALKPIEANLPTNEFRTLQEIVDRSVSQRRFLVVLLGGFACFALILASLGIYAVISYSVTRRGQEIGIRMALGESALELQGRIVKETLGLAGIGMVIGSLASWGLAKSISGLLFGVSAADPISFFAMLLIIGLVAILAGYIPARRASKIDPMIALRAS